jgi:hypothetical protein
MTPSVASTLSVREAAELLGRDRTRVYALVRSGDLVTVPGTDADDQDLLRIDRASVERWAVAGGRHGSPLTPRNAWAIIGLASGDASLSDRCVGLLERREELSRIRGRLARDGLLGLAPRLRRRAALNVVHVPLAFFVELECDAGLVRTGASAAVPYGWTEFSHTHTQSQADPESQTQAATAWALDAYVPQAALDVLLDQVPAAGGLDTQAVLLRSIDGLWPFREHCQLTPQPLAALDLLDYPDGFFAAPRPRAAARTRRGAADDGCSTDGPCAHPARPAGRQNAWLGRQACAAARRRGRSAYRNPRRRGQHRWRAVGHRPPGRDGQRAERHDGHDSRAAGNCL